MPLLFLFPKILTIFRQGSQYVLVSPPSLTVMHVDSNFCRLNRQGCVVCFQQAHYCLIQFIGIYCRLFSEGLFYQMCVFLPIHANKPKLTFQVTVTLQAMRMSQDASCHIFYCKKKKQLCLKKTDYFRTIFVLTLYKLLDFIFQLLL